MAPVTTAELAEARRVAAAAVRIGPDGPSVRMPRLGSVRHGSVEAGLRGCPCQPCDRTRDGLLVDQADQVDLGRLVDQVLIEEVQDQGLASVVEPELVAGGPVRDHPVADLPAELVAALPAGTAAAAGFAARSVVQGHAIDDADCARLLLMLGLAAERDADDVVDVDDLSDADEGLVLDAALLEEHAVPGPDLVDLVDPAGLAGVVAGGSRGAAA